MLHDIRKGSLAPMGNVVSDDGVTTVHGMDNLKPQGGYLAKRCPEAVQLDVLRPCEPLQPSPFMTMLAEGGIAFEAEVFAKIVATVPDAVVVDKGLLREERERLTLDATAEGATVVLGGRLPADRVSLRVGEPDLLIRSDARSKGISVPSTYLPVDVKHHLTLTNRVKESSDAALTSPAYDPWFGGAAENADLMPRWQRSDLLQLAHYQRMLEQLGLAPAGDRRGGIIGKEGVIVWYDLDLPAYDSSPYLIDPPPGPLSSMDLYDVEFAHRLGVLSAAVQFRAGHIVPLLAESIAVPECAGCPWHDWCYEQMEDSGELSLLPQMTADRRQRYHSFGVTTMHELASLDWTTAGLASGGVGLSDYVEAAASSDPSTLVADLLSQRPKQAQTLAEHGFLTAGDARRIDRRTAELGASRLGLPQQIDNARARLGRLPAYRRRGNDGVVVPRANIEVDIDMENVSDGCYLWGTLLSRRSGPGGTEPTFAPFVSWDPVTSDGEIDAFLRFWQWLTELRSDAARSGLTFRAYCYHEGAENGQMRRVADRCGLRSEVEAFIGSDEWVDLLPIVRDQLITGTGFGLKVIAPIAGFHWRGDDAGGIQAMVRYLEATTEFESAERTIARAWLLDYNEDDVSATAALREWLDTAAKELPSIADVGVDGPEPV